MLNKYKDGTFFVRVVYVVVRAQRNGGELMEKAPVPKGTETFTTAAPLPTASVFYRLSAIGLPSANGKRIKRHEYSRRLS